MKKFIITSLTAALLLAAGQAFAVVNVAPSDDASHELEIVIPQVLMIRIVADGNSAVVFDYGAEFDQYFDLLEGGSSGDLAPTQPSFDDISVFANYDAWTVSVAANGDALVSDRVSVHPSAGSGFLNGTSFALDGSTIATGAQTQGWRSLGISGSDYRLFVDGTEVPGQYSATITYSITTP